MPCCGQKRAAFLSGEAQPPAVSVPPVAPVPLPAPSGRVRRMLQLEYLQAARIQIAGPVTGAKYEFSAAQRMQPVDARDAEAMLKTRFFRLR